MTPAFRHSQRGAGALVVSMLLLFASSIIVFFLNRGLIFEQKTSANQVRATTAFEVAEAGIEWATGMLNQDNDVLATCVPNSAGASSFRRLYVQTGFPTNKNVAVTTNTFPGCKLNGTTLTCNCPTPGVSETVANLGSAALPNFTIAFAAVNDPVTGVADPKAVRVTATGCTAQAGVCKPVTAGSAATTGNSDATATVSVILKVQPKLAAVPQSALTCGGSCAVGGSYNIINTEVSSNGYLVNAGDGITSGMGTTYQTIPGQPVENGLIAEDESLDTLSNADSDCSQDAIFNAFFGTSMEAYAETARSIPNCTNPDTCGTLIQAAFDQGARSFYFPDGMSLNDSAPFDVLGIQGEGVQLVSPAAININGDITINGLLFSNSANFNDLGAGNADINGAIISCNTYNNNGNGTLRYDSSNLGGSGLGLGTLVRVPGSWRDF